jgi:site-specific recombinase XerD
MTTLVPAGDSIEVITTPPTSRAEAARAAFLNSYREGKTKRAYTGDLKRYFLWCQRVGVDPLAVRRQHIEAWVREMERTLTRNGPTAPATVHRAVCAVRCYYTYAVDAEIIDKNPVPATSKTLHLVKASSRSGTTSLDRDEATRVLAVARARSARDGAIVSLMLHQALRIAEVCQLHTDSLSTSRSHRTITVLRKGGQYQTLALAPVAANDLEDWLVARAAQQPSSGTVALPGEVGASPPLFLTALGERVRYWHIEHVVKQVAKDAGINKRVSPHSLRHTAITQLLDEGVPIRDVQVFAGHADPKTTIRYDHDRVNLDRSPAYRLSGIFG